MKIIRENSSFRFWWDLGILVLIFVSCTIIPYQLVFIHQPSFGSSQLIYLIDLFFLLDIALNFRTTFQRHGTEITSRTEIRKRYFKGSFAIHLLAALPLDLFFLLAGAKMMFFQTSIVLLLRLPRLLRLIHLHAIIKRWEWLNWSNPVYLRIFRFLSIIFLAVHWIACLWFFIGYADGFPSDSWMVIAGVAEATVFDQYIRSLYWTITTMTTVGYGDISPGRSVEYIVGMIVMGIGASTYAFIIGSVASLFSNIDAAKASYWNRVEAISSYLHHRQVPQELGEKVRSYYDYMWAKRRGLQEGSLFTDLPGPLRLEVMLHLTNDLLDKVPLFKYSSPALRDALLEALQAQTYAPDGWVVKEGEIGSQMFFISSGQVEVVAGDGTKKFAILEAGEYFGDLSLLLKEHRTASVRTLSFCEILILEGQHFERIKNDYSEFRTILKKVSSEKSEKMAGLVLDGIIL